jgi:hypothetical protein
VETAPHPDPLPVKNGEREQGRDIGTTSMNHVDS